MSAVPSVAGSREHISPLTRLVRGPASPLTLPCNNVGSHNYDPNTSPGVVLSYHKIRGRATRPRTLEQRTAGSRQRRLWLGGYRATLEYDNRQVQANSRGDCGWAATPLGHGQAKCSLNELPDPRRTAEAIETWWLYC